MKYLILTLLLTASTASSATPVTSGSTFQDESCIVRNIQSLYNIDSIDEKLQDLRELQIHDRNQAVIKRAINKEEELHKNITSIAYTLCE